MSNSKTRRWLIAYDIPLDSRRTAISKLLQRHGDRFQYSVFVVDAKPARMLTLQADLEQLMDSDEDSILICDLGLLKDAAKNRFIRLGISRYLTADEAIII